MKYLDKRWITGWIAVGLSIFITCVWAFWGIIENFHEGWYHESWLSNVGLMFIQYLSPMLIFLGVTLISIYWPRFGGGLHMIFALLAVWFFQAFSNAATFLIILQLPVGSRGLDAGCGIGLQTAMFLGCVGKGNVSQHIQFEGCAC